MVWIDCEMTGLDLEKDALIEVAVLVTDGQLNVLDEGLDLLIKTSDEQLAVMGDYVRDMHTKSGLLVELQSAELTMCEAEKLILDYVKQHVPQSCNAPLAGNSIGTDRGFLARDMPKLNNYLHYRNVDVSSIKELCRRWYPQVTDNAPLKLGGHRALADIQESIEELRYFREAIFVPMPGPDVETTQALAASIQGSLTGIHESGHAI